MDTRLPDLGPRGEGWLAGQVVLFVALSAALALGGPAWSGAIRVALGAVGLALVAAGGGLAVRGLLDLGRNLTPFPRPIEGAALVSRGAFGLVRHPIYGGIVIAAAGLGLLAASVAALGVAVLMAGFFDLKSRREERWLVERVPGYAAYRRRVRRLIPWVY
jgi:protein-S-isoprenylcysteine O-methyltransferase Ste14